MGSALVGLTPRNWVLQASQILDAESATLDITIPSGFKILVIYVIAKHNYATLYTSRLDVRFNSNGGTVYDEHYIEFGNSSGSTNTLYTGETLYHVGLIANNSFTMYEIVITNVPTGQYRSVITRGGDGVVNHGLIESCGKFKDTADVTQVTCYPTSASFKFTAGSQIYAYGVN